MSLFNYLYKNKDSQKRNINTKVPAIQPGKKRTRFVIGVLTFGFLISTLASFVPQSTSFAIPTNQADCTAQNGTWEKSSCTLSPDVQAQQWAYLNSLVDCMSRTTFQVIGGGGMIDNSFSGPVSVVGDRVSETHFFAADWFNDNMKGTPSFVNGNYSNDSTSCNTILQKGLASWGYSKSDYKTILCQFVPYRANSSSCATGSGDFGVVDGRAPDVYKIVSQHLYGKNSAPALSNAEKYAINLAAFTASNGCSARPSSSPGKDYAYKNVSIVDPITGKVTETTYEGKKTDTSIDLYTTSNGQVTSSKDTFSTCAQIAAAITKYAPDYSAWVASHKTAAQQQASQTRTGSGSANGDDSPTCGDIVSAIGWIVCPVLNAVGGLDDAMWNLVVGPLLNVSPLAQSPDLQKAWSSFRNVANIVLVVVFLIIIFSQLTGAGVSNYGVKKMLPRLVIAAILINVSFVIIQIAVDLSNIIGNSLYQFIAHLGQKHPIGLV